MKKPDLTSVLAVATLFLAVGSSAVTAEEVTSASDMKPSHRDRKQFDLNNDGQIDAEERAAAEVQMRAKLTNNPKFVERADTDKDGIISDGEWATAKEKMKDHRRQDMHQGRGRSERADQSGGKSKEFRHGYLLGKYDVNDDGKLDETERAAVRVDMEAKKRARMEKQLAKLQSVDSDNDGKISDEEWAVAKEKFKSDHPGMKDRGPQGRRMHSLEGVKE